jgi:subtilisin family serine protease
MVSFTTLSLALLALATATFAAPTEKSLKVGDVIPGKYIITMKDGVSAQRLNSLVDFVESTMRRQNDASPISNVFNIHDTFKGFSGDFADSEVEKLQRDENVARVTPARVVAINNIQQKPPSWGLARVGCNEKKADLSKYEYPDSAGEGVTAYVVDTGCNPDHEEFEGRASLGQAFGSDSSKDGHGHGTHVSGTIAGKEYGIAKKAKIVCVKVLDDRGSGSDADVIGGVDWVAKDAKDKKAVANMSLGGEASDELDKAVEAAIEAGVTFVLAAGNESQDACNVSPARTEKAITVAASTKSDTQAFFSNFGKCVDIYAPGDKIKSSWFNGGYKTISGTSMASPHVAGVAALYLGEDPTLTPQGVRDALVNKGTKDVIKNPSEDTLNVLAFSMYKYGN